MDERLRALELRQRSLLLRSERQRREIAAEGAGIEARFGGFASQVSRARRFLSLPALAAGAAVLLFVGPARTLRFASRVLLGVTLARRVLAMVGGLAMPRSASAEYSASKQADRD